MMTVRDQMVIPECLSMKSGQPTISKACRLPNKYELYLVLSGQKGLLIFTSSNLSRLFGVPALRDYVRAPPIV